MTLRGSLGESRKLVLLCRAYSDFGHSLRIVTDRVHQYDDNYYSKPRKYKTGNEMSGTVNYFIMLYLVNRVYFFSLFICYQPTDPAHHSISYKEPSFGKWSKTEPQEQGNVHTGYNILPKFANVQLQNLYHTKIVPKNKKLFKLDAKGK